MVGTMNPIERIDNLVNNRLSKLRWAFTGRALSIADQIELQRLFDHVEGSETIPGGVWEIELWLLQHPRSVGVPGSTEFP